MKQTTIAVHFASHLQELTKNRRHEASHAVSTLALTLAIEQYGQDQERAVKFLTKAGVSYPTARYGQALRDLVKGQVA